MIESLSGLWIATAAGASSAIGWLPRRNDSRTTALSRYVFACRYRTRSCSRISLAFHSAGDFLFPAGAATAAGDGDEPLTSLDGPFEVFEQATMSTSERPGSVRAIFISIPWSMHNREQIDCRSRDGFQKDELPARRSARQSSRLPRLRPDIGLPSQSEAGGRRAHAAESQERARH